MLTPQIAAEIVRQRLGDPDSSKHARYIFLIPDALKSFARKVAANRFLRQQLMTVKEDTTIPISGGVVDLTDSDDYPFLLEYLDYGKIYHPDSIYPVKIVSAQRAKLPTPVSDFIYAYLEGTNLVLIGNHTGSLSFNVPFYPLTLDDLPEHEELEKMFIDKLVELATGTQNDAAEDGEK